MRRRKQMKHRYLRFGSQVLASGLVLGLAANLAGPLSLAQTLPVSITISTLKGDGATGRVRQRSSQDPVVRIVDDKDTPISGAAVVFTLPTEGATGAFGNGAKTVTIVTDNGGIAAAQGLRFNQIPGKVPVHISASYKGLTARANIVQLSEAPAGYKPGGGGSGKIIAILAVLAAGGAGGAIYAASQKSGSVPPASAPPAPVPAISLTPGTGSLAPPR
jgi:hypothetical protein